MLLPARGTRVWHLARCGAIAILAGASGRVSAQTTAGRPVVVGAIEGVVRGQDGKPIADVEISAPALVRSFRTDSVGEFLLSGLPAGPVELHFRRLAFSPAIVSVDVEPRDTISVVVTLSVVALQLNAVVVNEDAARLRIMHEFEDRRKSGFGHFITRQEIQQRDPRLLSDMARRIPGAILTPVAGGSRYVLHFARARACEPQYWVDGAFVQGFNIDDVLPSDVEGVEFYSGPSTLPAKYTTPRSNPACGTVLIWTRVP